jgi:hypothetical protein
MTDARTRITPPEDNSRLGRATRLILGITALCGALTELVHAIEPSFPSIISFVSNTFFRHNISNLLIGQYQVHLGPNGGCNGGKPNTNPATPARIDDNEGLTATNECGQTSSIRIVDDTHGYWWQQPITFHIANGAVTITEDAKGGNYWDKFKQ